ncbi:uncharacterized protein LOC113151989 [Scomber scombrus]|uniref:Uncharacterized protein LOC113151989 n=1 Tax=Scomber scombrus TaxID=13677 RepID=A0AAV1PT52_SCOSC
MDRRRMDAEGGRVVYRDRRAGKIAVVVAVQNILVAACLLVTLYVYWGAEKPTFDSGDDVHIQFDAIGDKLGNVTLEFNTISSSYMMSLADKKIFINCTGPYILYMDVCYKSIGEQVATGILELQNQEYLLEGGGSLPPKLDTCQIMVIAELWFGHVYKSTSETEKERAFLIDAGPPSDTEKVNITSTLKESDEKGRYDIFTTKKDATYLIYGWVKTSDMAREEVILMWMWRSNTRTLQKKTQSETETVIFFSTEVNLVNNSRISIYLKSTCTDSVFHVYEL